MTITGRLVLLALVGVLLATWSSGAVLIYAVALVALAGVDLLLAAPIAGVLVTRGTTGAVRLHERAETVLTLTNHGRRTAHAVVRDAWVPSAGLRPRQQRVRIPPAESRRVSSALVPTRRGERRAVRLTIRSLGPLGLAARQRSVAVPGAVRVLPPFSSRRFLPEKLARLRQLDGAVTLRQRGAGSEFDALRTYVDGDDARAIDWRATARSRDLVVRTWRPERDRLLVLAIDTGRTSAARLGDEPRLDASIDAALLLGALAARAGDRVALLAADVVVRGRLSPTTGADVLPRLVTSLTSLEPALVETDGLLLAGQIRRLVTKRSLVVLFATLDDAAGDGVTLAVSSLVGRHEVIVAAPADPMLTTLASRRGDVDETYTAAAAELALLERRQVAERLRRLGATVVDAPADRFASRVADAYLDLKAAGRL